ncbi:hypothetical protein [Roseateles sp.]|jgi:hypothetical protein|uniref:hypothetical protein n=1 Tax=Roseateles sp. TaxID=1971397 RepID=UPI0037CA3517
MATKTPELFQGPEAVTPESAWPAAEPVASAPTEAERAAALEQLALYHARCEDAASACWYLCRSLGAARQLTPDEPGLELLFELLGALADLPAEVAAAPTPPAQGEADGLGVFELCQQLEAARELSQQAWAEREDEGTVDIQTPAPVAVLLH